MSPLPQSLQENLVKEAATKNFGYPLAALVGQEEMFAALIFLAVDPNIGGVLLMGEKGTAKSTAARALAEVTPPFLARDCPFNCRADQVENWCDSCRRSPGPFKMVSPPLKTVPLGVTEERLLGGLDWEKTAKGGKPVVRPGLLGAANNGLIYIDEVNLLEPSLAHLMLDAVSSRKVRVERDSFSLYHPSNVAMLGSMNPEEGPLGPQLADRFALTVRLASEKDPLIRAEIIRRRLEYEQNPKAFVEKYQSQSLNLTERISRARLILPSLSLSSGARIEASRLALVARAAGHRAELALSRAALAACAWELAGSQEAGDLHKSPIGDGLALQVEAMWIDRVQDFIIPQRRRSIPPSRVAIKVTRVKTSERASEQVQTPYVYSSEEKPAEFLSSGLNEDGQMPMTLFEAAQGYDIVTPKMPTEGGAKDKSGRRGYRETLKARGRAYRTTARRLGRPLSLAATLRAAAPYQSLRRQRLEDEKNNDDLILRAADFREKVYRLKTGRLVIFVVDSSGSIGTLYRMEEAKAAAMALLKDAYRQRDRVAVIAFYGLTAELLLPPTNSPDLAGRLLANLPSGGKTPLAAALVLTNKLISTERARDPKLVPHVILMTDGRPNIPLDGSRSPWPEVLEMAEHLASDPTVRFLLIDTDRGAYNDYKLTRQLALSLGCPRFNLEELRLGLLTQWLKDGHYRS